jgi:cobalt-zinc-cadmium efflux system membrane fusion protein
MDFRGLLHRAANKYLLGGVVAVVALVGGASMLGLPIWSGVAPTAANAASDDQTPPAQANAGAAPAASSVELTPQQLPAFKIETAATHVFPVEVQAVGSIDFNQDMSSQVFTPYQGRILALFAKVGDDVGKGQTLFTVDSPDLVQAESTLINTAGLLQLTNKALARTKGVLAASGAAQKDLEQAISDQQGAEGNFKAAVDAVRIFGKSQAEIDNIVATRKVDSSLIVASPISGRVTARSAAPGLFVQPGNGPAPFTVTDISTMWMLGNVPEIDSAAVKVGQAVKVSVMANPDQLYEGRITTVAATVDPNLHTLLVRSEVQDPRHELRPGMFAHFVIRTGDPVTGIAVPVDSVVREGDGTMTVWVTIDRHKFTQRVVRIGLQHEGYDQILDGLNPGELVVSDGAVFLDNMLNASPTD